MYIKVRVIAGAKQESVEELKPGSFLISVREKAQRNMANARVVALVAARFAAPANKVRIVSGHHHPIKLLSVDGER